MVNSKDFGFNRSKEYMEKRENSDRRNFMGKTRRKSIGFLVSLFAAAAFMTGASASSWAAASLNAGNTTLAAEKISATTDYPAAAVNTAYQSAGPVAASTVLKISLTNGKFAFPSDVDICKGTTLMGSGTIAAAPGNTSSEIGRAHV